MRKAKFGLLVLLTVIVTPVFAQSVLIDLSSQGARIDHAGLGKPLAVLRESGDVILDYLRVQGRSEATLASLSLVRSHVVERTGITHYMYEQEINGVRVYGTYVKASVSRDGALISVMENLVTPPASGVRQALIGPEAALMAALKRHYPDYARVPERKDVQGKRSVFSRGEFFYRDPTVTEVLVPMMGGELHTGFLAQTWDKSNVLHHTVIGRDGEVVHEELRTQNDSYNVFPISPLKGPQTVVQGPGIGNALSPIGWVFADTTIGNNVDAYLDADGNNQSDPDSRPISATGDFLYVVDFSKAPNDPESDNSKVSVQNLFYLNNVIHDRLYQHGFTESAGNFQEYNFVPGGLAGDPVNAEAQEAPSFFAPCCNANFASPPDGERPRMQVWLFYDQPGFTNPRDGALDADLIWHEYGHGLTWRMIGGMSGAISGGLGEGASDALAILATLDDVPAEYATGTPVGWRRYPYANYPLTYKAIEGSTSLHANGEIYAAAMWRLWELLEADGIPVEILLDYFVDGMNYTPPGPSYENMREGLLMAIQHGGVPAHRCQVWKAFAQFGIGVDSHAVLDANGRPVVAESFEVPCDCDFGVVAVTALGTGDKPKFEEQVQTRFAGHILNASDLASGVSASVLVCPNTTVDYEAFTTDGRTTAACTVDGAVASTAGIVGIGNELVCSNTPRGKDTDSFTIMW